MKEQSSILNENSSVVKEGDESVRPEEAILTSVVEEKEEDISDPNLITYEQERVEKVCDQFDLLQIESDQSSSQDCNLDRISGESSDENRPMETVQSQIDFKFIKNSLENKMEP